MDKNQIKYLIEKATGIEDLSVRNRKRYIAESRFVYYALCRKYLPRFTLAAVGSGVERDHASVIHGERQFKTFYEDKGWFGKYLYDLCTLKIEEENFMMRLRNQQLKKDAVCGPSNFKIAK